MKVLVTGATGFVGKRLARALVFAGHDLVVACRLPERARASIAVPGEFHAWDAVSGAFPVAALEGVEAVVHLAGEGVGDKRWSPERKQRLYDSRVLGTRSLMQCLASRTVGRPSVVVSASAIGFYGDRGDEILTESSPPGTDFLAGICRDWEAELTAPSLPDVRRISVRIGIVLGPEGGALQKLLPLFRAGAGGTVGSGKQWMSWIHVDDLVSLLMYSIENREIVGPVNGVAPEPVTNKVFSEALARQLGRPAVVPTPAFAVKLLMGEMATLVLSSQRVSADKVLGADFRYDYPKLEAALAEVCGEKKKAYESLTVEKWVPLPVQKIFPFFADAKNLEILTPPWLAFKVLRSTTAQIGKGTLIDYQLRIRGVPVRWQSLIESWEENQSFVDTQTRGPYALWHHTHRFASLKGGTLMTDTVRYRVPGGWLGKLIAGRRVAKDVRQIFEFRSKKINELYGGRPAK